MIWIPRFNDYDLNSIPTFDDYDLNSIPLLIVMIWMVIIDLVSDMDIWTIHDFFNFFSVVLL